MCECRRGKERSYIIRRGEFGCHSCLRAKDWDKALHLDTADLLPEDIREGYPCEGLRPMAIEALQEAFASRRLQLQALEKQALAELPAIQPKEEPVAVLDCRCGASARSWPADSRRGTRCSRTAGSS
jgi:hypothetical protein